MAISWVIELVRLFTEPASQALSTRMQKPPDRFDGSAVTLLGELELRRPADDACRAARRVDAELAPIVADRHGGSLNGIAVEVAVRIQSLQSLRLIITCASMRDAHGSGALTEDIHGIHHRVPFPDAAESADLVPQRLGVHPNRCGLDYLRHAHSFGAPSHAQSDL